MHLLVFKFRIAWAVGDGPP